MLKKLGFSKVIISISGEDRIFEYGNLSEDTGESYISDQMPLDKKNSDSFIQFWGGKSRFTKRRFDLNCDIAFESWILSAKRWKELNHQEYSFNGVAIEQDNPSIEKARDLYLP